MDLDDLFDMEEDEDDEEANERERRELIKRREMESAAARKAKDDRRQAEEDRLYKQPKIESPKLTELLNRKTIWLNADKKKRFTSLIPQFVELFDETPSEFVTKMKTFKYEKNFRMFLRNWYEKNELWSYDHEKKLMHDWLEEFSREVVESLWEMTSIPKPDASTVFGFSNIFTDLKEKAVVASEKTPTIDIFDKFSELRKEEERIMMESTLETLSALSISVTENPVASREIQMMSFNLAPERGTSPPRRQISEEAQIELTNALKDFFVQNKEDTEMEVEDPDLADLFTTVDEDSNDSSGDLVHPSALRNIVPIQNQIEIINIDDDDDSSDFEDEDVLNEYPELQMPVIVKSESTSDYNYEEFMKHRFEDRRQRRKRVKFVDYESPLNVMRIFVAPHTTLMDDGDDGPITDYIDLSLCDGYQELHKRNYKKPFVHIRPDKSNSNLQYAPQKITDHYNWERLQGCHGNILGRFWFQNTLIRSNQGYPDDRNSYKDIERHEWLCEQGYLRQYTPSDLKYLFHYQLGLIHPDLRRGYARYAVGNYESHYHKTTSGTVSGVLIFTDWRLAHLHSRVILNGCFQLMPTSMGDMFFRTMAEYIVKLCRDPNIEFHTIIFAFGGSPLFEKASFLRFWEKLIFETGKSIEVVWTAQDWCDGLECTQISRDYMDDFNYYVKKVFDKMNRTGHKNYKWCNIREKYNIPEKKLDVPREGIRPNVDLLQDLLFNYVKYFVTECNVYADSSFYYGHNFENDPVHNFEWE